MATIRVRDWTKERLEEILEAESHSSHDSVIKALLQDRRFAEFAAGAGIENETTPTPEPVEKRFGDLTVLNEVVSADNDVLFLWCPNCGSEIAYLNVEDPTTLSVFEVECQRCLSRLDGHSIVGIEIGYPIEKRIVEEDLRDDLQACVVDYWDRLLAGDDNPEEAQRLVAEVGDYVREFGWEWPSDVPVVALEAGETYRDARTDEEIEVLEALDTDPPGEFRVRAGGEERTLGTDAVVELIRSRSLYATSGE